MKALENRQKVRQVLSSQQPRNAAGETPRAQRPSAEEQLRVMQQRVQLLEYEVQYERELRTVDQKVSRKLDEENGRLRELLQKLKLELQTKIAENAEARLAAVQGQQDSNKRLEEHVQTAQELKRALEASDKKLQERELQLKELQSHAEDAAKKQVQEHSAELKSVQQSLQNAEQALQALRQQDAEKQERLDAAAAVIRTLEAQNVALEEAVAKVMFEREKLSDMIEYYKGVLEAQEAEIVAQNGKLKAFQRLLRNQETQTRDAEARVAALEIERTQLKLFVDTRRSAQEQNGFAQKETEDQGEGDDGNSPIKQQEMLSGADETPQQGADDQPLDTQDDDDYYGFEDCGIDEREQLVRSGIVQEECDERGEEHHSEWK